MAFGSVVTEELVAMPAAPFAEVVVAPMCFHSKGIDVAMNAPLDEGCILEKQVPNKSYESGRT